MRTWLRSLEGSLAVRLGLLYLLAMAFAVGALLYQAYDTAGSLNDRDLNLRATDLARYVVLGPDHTPRLELPPKLAAAYETGSSDLYAVRSPDGRVIAASPRSFGDNVPRRARLPGTQPHATLLRTRCVSSARSSRR